MICSLSLQPREIVELKYCSLLGKGMLIRYPGVWAFMLVLGACGSIDQRSHFVGGQVHGLWDGAQGVVVQLEANGSPTLLTIAENGGFRFPQQLGSGTSYMVTVVTSPDRHSCVVDKAGDGIVADQEITAVSIACTGPVTAIELSGQWGWTVDLTQDTQTFAGSVVVQDVALTVRGDDVSSVSVDGMLATPGKPTSPVALPLGTRMVPVVLTAGELSKTYQLVFDRGGKVLDQLVYGKASNTGASDQFGYSVSLSGDTLAVSAFGEASAANGINGSQTDNAAPGAGAVYVFIRSGTTWTQQAYLKASNTTASDGFGVSVSLSGDTLAVGADSEDSGVVGKQDDNAATNAGAVYVFVRSGTTWTQQAYLKASNPGSPDHFGVAVSLSGNSLAVGAYLEDSASPGINGIQNDETAPDAGAVYVFVRSGVTWAQQAYIKASNPSTTDYFGRTVSLSGDTLAVGAYEEDSSATGVNGAQNDIVTNSGAVYVFIRNGVTWVQQAYIKPSNTAVSDFFGYSVALSGDTLAVGALLEDSSATGVNGNQSSNDAADSGAVYVFVRNGTLWTQQAYLKPSNTGMGDNFGCSVALSGDTLAVGACQEDSATTLVNGDAGDNAAVSSGAAYVFVRSGATWTQEAYVKASNAGPSDTFGFSVALSGSTLVVGANLETSGAIGINPDGQTNNGTAAAGAVYLFR
jgi:trimeric autotransporter adhesin